MRTGGRLSVITIALAALAIGGCGDDSSEGGSGSSATPASRYPAAMRDAFLSSCSTNAKASSNGKIDAQEADRYCERTLTCVEGRLTAKEFEATEAKMLSGADNPEMKVLTDCAEASAPKR